MLTDEQLIRQDDENIITPVASTEIFSPIKNSNISHVIVDRLAEAIKREEFKPGQKLPSEKELMDVFQVGRSSVREALHSLVALKLVEARAGKGYYVKETSAILHSGDLVQFAVSEREFLDIMEAREEIEPRIARLAAQRVLPEDLKHLEKAYSEIERAAAHGKYHYTGAIHLGIARAAHNAALVRIIEALLPMFPGRVRGRTIPIDEGLRMHRKLIDGLRRGDGKVMEQLMVEHLRATRRFYVNVMGKGTSRQKEAPTVIKEKGSTIKS